MDDSLKALLEEWAWTYNDPRYFQEDPIIFPKEFAVRFRQGECRLQDVEIAGLIASHLAWGRRSMIVRDCNRVFDEMQWKPYDYVMAGDWRDEHASVHRTIRWSDLAAICRNLQSIYRETGSIEGFSDEEIRCRILGQKPDPKAPNKKISMMRRWMVRNDGKVDLGVWEHSNPKDLILPLDIHVYTQAEALGLTDRKQKDRTTALQITEAFREIFPEDPCLGDFALFGYDVTHQKG